MGRESYDYVVVGAGSAGCAVAARLSEDPEVTVALIEAGPPARGRLFEIPALFSQQLKTAYDWDFETEPESRLAGRRAYLPRGRAIGGTSSMNTMLYVRGHRYDYDTWERLGSPGWGYDDVLPFFKKSEDNERGADGFHGVGGPLTVSDPRSVHPLLTAWVEAAQDAGYKHNPDFNGADQEGVGYHQVTQRGGLRCSSAIAFLEPAAGRPNLTVLPSTTALRLSFDGSRATGLEVDHLGTVRTIHADREIVLSLGAYNSPHLLLQSGVGPAEELTAGGITPLHDLPDVGRNMQDHTGCFISFFSDTEPLLGPDTSAEEQLCASRAPARWPGTRPAASSAPATTSPPRTSRSTPLWGSSATRVSPRRWSRACRSGPTSRGPRAAARCGCGTPTRTPSRASSTTTSTTPTTADVCARVSACACASPVNSG